MIEAFFIYLLRGWVVTELTAEKLDERYKEWLDTQPIKVYCSNYPVFLSKVFPGGVKVVAKK